MSGNHGFVLAELVMRDFRIRYRNMSLGIFWSLANPLVMMGVLTYIFTRVHPVGGNVKDFHLFVLCGLVVFSFFSLSWSSATVSLVTNAGLIKRVPMAREIIPVATVLANGIHALIQIALLLVLVLLGGYRVNALWLWLPVLFLMEAAFVCGLSLITSALDVYFRDVQYVVDSTNLLLFWMVPIFYTNAMIPAEYQWLDGFNPISAVVLMLRQILFESRVEMQTIGKLTAVSLTFLAAGILWFRLLKKRFADYL